MEMGTYCGKQCAYCVDKLELNCPGCKEVPGAERQKDCEIAACCRSKEYDSCASCNMSVGCGRQLGRNAVPALRKKKKAEAAAHRAELTRKSAAIAEWLILLFWLVIPGVLAAVLSGDFMAGALPGLLMPCLFLRILISVACGIILLRLSAEERRYLPAGLCALGTAVLTLVYSFIPVEETGLSVACTAATIIVGLVGENREYGAHSFILRELDEPLALRWKVLWKWYATANLGSLAGLVIIGMAPLLGGTVVIVCLVMSVVVGVKKLLYLRQTIIALREGPQ